VLYRALGQGEPFEPEIISMKRPDEGYLLICSDGLWNIVQEEKISDIILNSPSPQEAVSLLIEAANQAGGPDNISVILVDLPDLKT
jgi:protein phosphatase